MSVLPKSLKWQFHADSTGKLFTGAVFIQKKSESFQAIAIYLLKAYLASVIFG
jgi:hypothetical protein